MRTMATKEQRGFGNGRHRRRDDVFEQQVEIRLPHWRILRLAARSVLLAVAVLSLPWIGTTTTTTFRGSGIAEVKSSGFVATATTKAIARDGDSGGGVLLGNVFFLPMLFRDLRREGVYRPGTGKALFLGHQNAHLGLPFLKQNNLDLVGVEQRELVASNSIDFIFAADGVHDTTATMAFIDRVLKPGGIAAVTLTTDPSVYLRLPSHYVPVYVRRFGSTIVAMKKTDSSAVVAVNDTKAPVRTGRKFQFPMLLDSKKAALNGLEDILFEPPRSSSNKYLKRTRYLPDELFLDCRNGWQRGGGGRRRRAYWECLALYGRLRDEGVSVHQWWG